MKYLTFLFAVLCLCNGGAAQTAVSGPAPAFNLGFEQLRDEKPAGWNLPEVKSYSVHIDSLTKHSGKYSLSFHFDGNNPSAGIALMPLPHIYQGKTITLSGYIKTKNVTGGRAALWMRIDPHIAMDNMSATIVTGTTDWKKYEISLKMDPVNSKTIVIGGLLIGKGSMWLDDLEIKVDGKPVDQATIFKGKQYPADKDTAFSQTSGITRMATDRQTLENLKILGLVWGYLNFYHPGVASGNYNWSNELFRLLPKVTAARNSPERDQILSDFISRLGPVEPDVSKDRADDHGIVRLQTDTSWFAGLSPRLSTQLSGLYDAMRPWPSYYSGFSQGAGNIVFEHERPFAEMRPEDIGLRLLALFRYWNAIEYFYPYKYLNGDWKKVLVKYIPVMIQADTRLKYEKGMTSLIAEIRDTHGDLNGKSVAMYKYYGEFTPAIAVSRVQGKWVVDRFLDSVKGAATGIKIGDVLERIDGTPVGDIVKERWPITPASNDAAGYRKMSWALLRTGQDSMRLVINGAGKETLKTVKTYRIGAFRVIQFADKHKAPFEYLSSDIGYIYPGTLKNGEVGAIMNKAANTKALIIDLRCYPAEFIVYSLGARLTADPVDFVRFSGMDYRHPGVFIERKPFSLGKKNPDAYGGKVVVLVNEYTQSQAEFTTMALQAAGATVIGSTTAGADGDVSNVQLPGNLSTGFSGLGVYYPDGTETQKVGIAVDIRCEPTIKGVREGRDEILERAIRFIEQGK